MSRVRFTVIVRVKVSVSLSIHTAEIASVLSIIRLTINTICFCLHLAIRYQWHELEMVNWQMIGLHTESLSVTLQVVLLFTY